MRLNIYDLVIIEINNIPTRVENFLKAEYYLLIDLSEPLSEPDVVVNFMSSSRCEHDFHIVKPPVAYDNEGVFWFDSNQRRCRISLDNFGTQTTVVECDEEFNIHFIAIIIEYLISFKLLRHGAIFCHASAFEIDGKVVMLPAWRHTGKTSILLSFLRENTRYIADDWVIFFRDGQIASFPKRLNLLYYNLQKFKFLNKYIPEPIRAYVQFVNYANEGFIDLNEEMISFLQSQIRIRIDVKGVFGQRRMLQKQKTDIVFYISREIDHKQNDRTNGGTIKLSPISNECLTTRITETVRFEQSHFHSIYTFNKALFGKTDALLEKRLEIASDIFREGLRNCQEKYEIKLLNNLEPERLKSKILKAIQG